MAQGFGAGVREAVGIDHGLEVRVAEDTGAFVASLGVLGDRADLDMAEAEGCRAPPAQAVLIKARRQADVVRELQTKGLDRLAALWGQAPFQAPAKGREGAKQPHTPQADLVSRFRVHGVERLGGHFIVQERHPLQLREENAEGKRRRRLGSPLGERTVSTPLDSPPDLGTSTPHGCHDFQAALVYHPFK